MIERSYDADRLNRLINDPSIRPFVGGDGQSPLDLTSAVANDDNVFLLGEYGGFAFSWSAPDTYEIHTFILPEGRGKAAYLLAREARDWMQAHGAKLLWTRVADNMESVRRFTLAAGFEICGCQSLDVGFGPVTYDLLSWRP